MDRQPNEEQRWQQRPVLSLAVRAVALLLPVMASVLMASQAAKVVSRPSGIVLEILWWLGLLVITTLTATVVERLSRRLLPLAGLLKLTLLFPGEAPSRLAVARRARGPRQLRSKLLEAERQHTADGTPFDSDTERSPVELILALAGALSAHDRRTRGHSERVRLLTDLLADELGLSDDDRDKLRWSSLLHDIGKLSVSTKVLNKDGKPDEREWAAIHRHPTEGARLAAPLLEWLGDWGAAIEQHHERYDGKGYPIGLESSEISWGARIVAVADSYETMTAARAYKRPLSAAFAREELARCAGTQFDPTVVRALLNLSMRRLWWAVGPLSWAAQLPMVGGLQRVGEQAVTFTGQAASAVTTVAGATALTVATAAAEPPAATPPAPHAIVASAPARTVSAHKPAVQHGAAPAVGHHAAAPAKAAPTTTKPSPAPVVPPGHTPSPSTATPPGHDFGHPTPHPVVTVPPGGHGHGQPKPPPVHGSVPGQSDHSGSGSDHHGGEGDGPESHGPGSDTPESASGALAAAVQFVTGGAGGAPQGHGGDHGDGGGHGSHGPSAPKPHPAHDGGHGHR